MRMALNSWSSCLCFLNECWNCGLVVHYHAWCLCVFGISFLWVLFYFLILGIELRVSEMVGNHSTTSPLSLVPRLYFIFMFLFFWEGVSCSPRWPVTWYVCRGWPWTADLVVCLYLPSAWLTGYKHLPLCPVLCHVRDGTQGFLHGMQELY